MAERSRSDEGDASDEHETNLVKQPAPRSSRLRSNPGLGNLTETTTAVHPRDGRAPAVEEVFLRRHSAGPKSSPGDIRLGQCRRTATMNRADVAIDDIRFAVSAIAHMAKI